MLYKHPAGFPQCISCQSIPYRENKHGGHSSCGLHPVASSFANLSGISAFSFSLSSAWIKSVWVLSSNLLIVAHKLLIRGQFFDTVCLGRCAFVCLSVIDITYSALFCFISILVPGNLSVTEIQVFSSNFLNEHTILWLHYPTFYCYAHPH